MYNFMWGKHKIVANNIHELTYNRCSAYIY